MVNRSKSLRVSSSGYQSLLGQEIPNHLALAMVGQTVSVLGRSNTIAHGVVTGVLTETGRPKLVVNRTAYDLNKVLSVTPTGAN